LSRGVVCRALRELREKREIFEVHGGGRYGSKKYRIQTSSESELVQKSRLTSPESELAHNIPKPDTRTRQGAPAKKFVKPTIEEVTAYCRERKKGVDPQMWMDYYKARGWKFKGGQAMKDWRAAVRTWEHNGFRTGNGEAKKPEPIKYRA
jgi:hypothetical protein